MRKSIVLALALSFGLSTASAETFDWYSKTTKTKTEKNIIYSDKNHSIGWNSVLDKDKKPDNVFGAKIKKRNSSIHIFATDDSIEAKVNQRIGSTNYDLGIGNNLFHMGFEKGFLKPFGYGASFVRKDDKTELRGELWKYWNKKVFTGVRKSNDKIHTIISLPRKHSFAIRYFDVNDRNSDFRLKQLIIGESRKGRYKLLFKDSWFLLQDQSIIGGESMRDSVRPLGYLAPPVAWRVKNWGAQLQEIQGKRSAEAAKYLDKEHWLGFKYEAGKKAITFSKSSKASNLALSIFHDRADLTLRLKW